MSACIRFGNVADVGDRPLSAQSCPSHRGRFIAVYLGKAEPSARPFRGKSRNNTRKPVRGKSFGGDQPDGRYDNAQGEITGSPHRMDRFFIFKSLQQIERKARNEPYKTIYG